MNFAKKCDIYNFGWMFSALAVITGHCLFVIYSHFAPQAKHV